MIKYQNQMIRCLALYCFWPALWLLVLPGPLTKGEEIIVFMQFWFLVIGGIGLLFMLHWTRWLAIFGLVLVGVHELYAMIGWGWVSLFAAGYLFFWRKKLF